MIVTVPPFSTARQLELEDTASHLTHHQWIVVSQARPLDGWKAAALKDARLILAPVVGEGLRRAIAELSCPSSKADISHSSGRDTPVKWRASTPLRVLLAEDNPMNQAVATRLLSKWGHTVKVAENGQRALEMRRAGSFDVILMDMQMPVMDGLAATAKIRQFESEKGLERLPIFAMTANAGDQVRERCLRAGMDEFITKPIDMPLLFRLMDKVEQQGPGDREAA